MKNIFSLRYILVVLICLGTRCGVFAQESILDEKGRYVFKANFIYVGLESYGYYGDDVFDGFINIFDLTNQKGLGGWHVNSALFVNGKNRVLTTEPYSLDLFPKEIKIENTYKAAHRDFQSENMFEEGTVTLLYNNKIPTDFMATPKGYLYEIIQSQVANPEVSVETDCYDLEYNSYNGSYFRTPWRPYDQPSVPFFGPYYGAFVFIAIPDKIKMECYLKDGVTMVTNRRISYNKEIVICATKGFLKEAYNWEYGVGKTVADVKNWNKVDTSFCSEDGSQITLKGSELGFSNESEFEVASDKEYKVYFRINTPTERNANIEHLNFDLDNIPQSFSEELIDYNPNYETLEFSLSKSSPIIEKVVPVMETCKGDETSGILVYFDREVINKEGIGVGFNGIYQESVTGNWLDNKTYFLPAAPSPSIEHKYKVTSSTYSGNVFEVNIPEREAVEYGELTIGKVSCFDGKDGSITISAKGGTGVYKATLFSDKEHKQIEKEPIEFKVAEKVKFENLKAGKYYMVLVDENNCSPKGQEVDTITITQPSESVKIDTLNIIKIMPKAYNSTDGSMSVYVYGGTIYDEKGGYTVILKNSDGVSYSHKEPYIDNGKYMYTFENLPKGKYTMIAQDARYSPSDVNPGDEPCGCMATYSFELIAPDPIKIVVKEEQSIKCNGDNDGVLVAKVTGGISPYTYHWAKGSDEIKGDSILRNAVAGKYCLVVEDANHTKSDSVYWEIKQPAPIEISFKVINPTFKKKYGSVEAIVTGGTPPYTYGWTKEGVTVNKLDSLETGEYQFYVMDSNKCGKDTTVHVSEPDEIKIDTLVFRHPSCYGTNDGEISLKISGKNSSYTAVWADNKNAGLTRKGLKPGEYTLKVSDSDGNEIELKYKMEQPEQMKLEVGSAFVLCKGQGRMITASSNVEDAEYQWKRNGREIQSAFGSELFVNQDGVYEVICKKKDSDCSVSASVNVSVSDVDLPIDITMSTDVEVDEKIHGVNISTAKMDKFEWILPDGAEKVSQSDNEIVFIMHTPGTYTVRAVGYKGGCTTEVLQTLNVKGDGEAPLPTADGDPLLKQFIVSPNPTDKEFNVHIELSEKANIKLTLKSPTGAEVETINVSDVTSYDHGYELNGDVTDCVFTLELSTGDNKQKSIQRIRKTIIKNEEK